MTALGVESDSETDCGLAKTVPLTGLKVGSAVTGGGGVCPVYEAEATALGESPGATARALIVSEVFTRMADAYTVELVLGVEPLVV